MSKHRLLELDALRGVAAFCVVLYHYIYRYDEIYSHPEMSVAWIQVAEFGVQLFFMISGFVIFWTLNRTQRPLDFIVSRFSRLYPVYWAALFVTFAVVSLFGLPGREVALTEAVMNVLMFHEYLFVPHVDGVYWTLTVELTFYFWMFTLYLTSRLDSVESYSLVIIFFSVLHSLGVLDIPAPIYKILLMRDLPMFLAGICFYRLMSDGGDKRRIMLTLCLTLLSSLAIYSWREFCIFAGFYAVFFLATSNRLPILSVRPLVALGAISYSLYLVHQNIGYVIINYTYQLGINPILGIIAAVLVSIAIATVLTKYVEKPSLAWIRSAYRQSEQMQKMARKLSFSFGR